MGKKKNKNKKKKKICKPTILSPVISTESRTPDVNQIGNNIPYKSCKASFSFEFYDHKNKRYSVSSISKCKDFHLLFKHLHKLSCLTWRSIENSKNRAHEVTWNTTKEKKGFPPKLKIPQGFPPYQFQLYGKLRVFGFHKMGIFYIVWFDPNHSIYS